MTDLDAKRQALAEIDLRLGRGEIDEETYDRLRQKLTTGLSPEELAALGVAPAVDSKQRLGPASVTGEGLRTGVCRHDDLPSPAAVQEEAARQAAAASDRARRQRHLAATHRAAVAVLLILIGAASVLAWLMLRAVLDRNDPTDRRQEMAGATPVVLTQATAVPAENPPRTPTVRPPLPRPSAPPPVRSVSPVTVATQTPAQHGPAAPSPSRQVPRSEETPTSQPTQVPHPTAPPALRWAGALWEDPAIGMRFRYIPAGRFEMGSRPEEPGRFDREGPQHPVSISYGFWIGETEVTQGQWRAVMGSNPSHFSRCGDSCPVESVSWNDAVLFANKLSETAGFPPCYWISGGTATSLGSDCTGYRLPSEAEWERAARAGSRTRYSWGDSDSASEVQRHAWYRRNAESRYWIAPHASREGTQRVGQKVASTWGLFDMHGNVGEWCEDDWHGSYQDGPVDGRAWIDSPRGMYRVIRGGSWSCSARSIRSASRYWDEPGYRGSDLGFRLALGARPDPEVRGRIVRTGRESRVQSRELHLLPREASVPWPKASRAGGLWTLDSRLRYGSGGPEEVGVRCPPSAGRGKSGLLTGGMPGNARPR